MRKLLLDSSAVIPLVIAEHENSQKMLSFLASIERYELFISQHTIAEVFRVATTTYKITNSDLFHILDYLIDNSTIKVVALTQKDYYKSIQIMIERNLIGATIYDALIITCGYKAHVDAVVTYNRKHFLQLTDANEGFIITPN